MGYLGMPYRYTIKAGNHHKTWLHCHNQGKASRREVGREGMASVAHSCRTSLPNTTTLQNKLKSLHAQIYLLGAYAIITRRMLRI